MTLPVGRIHVAYDILCNYVGPAVVPANNIGSFSFQPSTGSIYVNPISRWPATVAYPPTTWDADVVTGTATPPTTATVSLAPAFQGLAVGVWHRFGVTFDLVAGTHIDFYITNGVTGITTTYTPPTPLLLPLSSLGAPLPTDFRFFTGGTGTGNLMAIDNLTITYGANYTTFGAGCPGALGVPTLASAPGSLPQIGTTLNVVLGNLPLHVGVMCTGLSDTLALGSILLPFSLAGNGYPGCNLLVDPVVTQFLIGSANQATWLFTVPLTTAYNGLTIFNQGLSLDTGPAGLTFSNGGRCVIGL